MVGQKKVGAPAAGEETESDAARLEQLVGSLRSDPTLSVFLDEDFSPTAHGGNAIRQHRIQAALEESQRASSLLSANVRQEVIRRKEALLSEVEAVDALEKEVHSVSNGVSSLVSATEALSEALEKPFEPMRAALRRLTNLTAAADLLRAVTRFRHCTRKLEDAGLFPVIGPTSATNTTNLPPAAEALRELEELTSATGAHFLDKVDGIAKDIIVVRKASPELRKRAAAMLKAGLLSHTQSEIEAAVLAFHSLDVLQDRVNNELARLLRETQNAVHRGLEAPHSSGRTSLTGSKRSSDATEVWNNIENMLVIVSESCVKVILLQQVLSRRYCDVTHLSLLHDTIASNFIEAVSKTIVEQVSILSRTRLQRSAAAVVFLALAEGYPRLRGSLEEMAHRVSALAKGSPTPITKIAAIAKLPLIPDAEFIRKAFFSAVLEIETHYLTASLERLTKTVSSFYDGPKHPGETEALTLTKILAGELRASRSDTQLFHIAVSNAATALRLYTTQAEDYAAANVPDDDGKALGEIEEWHLTGLYNGLVTLASSATRVLGEQEDGSGTIPAPIAKEIATLTSLCDSLLDGPFSVCKNNVRSVLKRMHTEDLERESSDDGCSVYVLDIAAQLSMFADGIIPALARTRSLGSYTLSLARWVLDAFVQHAVLVFPQSELVKIRLSTDMARIELAVESLCAARLLGPSYKAIRALRTAILLDTSALIEPEAPILEQLRALGPSTLARLILGRSSDDTLQHPHRRKELSPDEYVSWIERIGEEVAWLDVRESLELYKKTKDDEPSSLEYEAITATCNKLQSV